MSAGVLFTATIFLSSSKLHIIPCITSKIKLVKLFLILEISLFLQWSPFQRQARLVQTFYPNFNLPIMEACLIAK